MVLNKRLLMLFAMAVGMSVGGIAGVTAYADNGPETPARFAPISTFSSARLEQIQNRFTETNLSSPGGRGSFAYSRGLKVDPVTPWPWGSKKDRAVLRDAMRTVLTGYATPEQLQVSGPVSKNPQSTFRRLDTMLGACWNQKARDSFVPAVALSLRESDESVRVYEGSESNSYGYGAFVMIVDTPNREILVLGMQYAE